MSTKGVASLLSDTLWRALTFPVTYLLVVVLVATALLQIRYVNRALQRFDSTQVIPVQFVLFTISVIIGSAVLYRDFQSATADRVGKFFGGCALTFLGVYLITSGRAKAAGDQDYDDMDDEENTIGLVDEEGYQDEVETHADDERKRQRSSISVAFEDDDDVGPRGSRRSSSQKIDGCTSNPQTPPRLLSNASAASKHSARNDSVESPLLNNPWRSHDHIPTSSARPRPLDGTISSPLLPSEAQRSGTSTPQPRDQKRLSLSRAGRPSALSRQSIARLTPGPLMAPLSSSLSAVVADSLRKGVDSPSGKRRPRPSGLQKSKSQRAMRSSEGGGIVTVSSSLKAGQASEEAIEDDGPHNAGRSQSVSATLGEFFRLKRERSKGKSNDRDADDTQQ